MARDRKRARQRRPRPAEEAPRTVRERAPAPSQSQPLRAEISDPPAPLEHVGDVDEFDAALADRRSASGADGVRLQPQEPSGNGSGQAPAARRERERRSSRGGAGATELEQGFGEDVAAEEAPVARPGQPLHRRTVAFLRASWAELQRVQWPDRRHVTQATTVVLGFLVVAGVYLGLADWVAQKIVNFVL